MYNNNLKKMIGFIILVFLFLVLRDIFIIKTILIDRRYSEYANNSDVVVLIIGVFLYFVFALIIKHIKWRLGCAFAAGRQVLLFLSSILFYQSYSLFIVCRVIGLVFLFLAIVQFYAVYRLNDISPYYGGKEIRDKAIIYSVIILLFIVALTFIFWWFWGTYFN